MMSEIEEQLALKKEIDDEEDFKEYVIALVRMIMQGNAKYPRENRKVLIHYHWITTEDEETSPTGYYLSIKVKHVMQPEHDIGLILFSAQELRQLYEVVEHVTGLTLSSIMFAEHESHKFDSTIEWLFTPQGKPWLTRKEYICPL